MWKEKTVFIFVFLVALFTASLMIESEMRSSLANNNKSAFVFSSEREVKAYYFYGEGCSHCERVKPFIAQIEQEHGVTIHKYEIYYDRNNAALLNQYFDMHSVPTVRRGIPALFVSDTYLVGDGPILSGLEEVLTEALKEESSVVNAASEFEVETPNALVEESVCSESATKSECLSVATVTVTALVDSINPCSMAVLLFLVGVRPLVSDRRKRALELGLAFSLSVFIAYTLFGLGLLSVIGVAGVSSAFGVAAGLVAIFAGALYVKDSLWHGSAGFVMEVPRSLRPLVNRMIKAVTSPVGAFLAGFAISCFELPCTGGPYLFILGQLANEATRLQTIPLLLYYNFLFTMPLLLVSLFLYFGIFSLRRAREWNERNKRLLRLVSGLTIIALGILVIPSSQLITLVRVFLGACRVVLPPVLFTLSSYLVFSFLRVHSMRVKRLATTVLLISLPVLCIFTYPTLVQNVSLKVPVNVGDSDVRFAQDGVSSSREAVARPAPSYPETVFNRGGTTSGEPGDFCRSCQDFIVKPETATQVMDTEYVSGNLMERTPDYRILLKSRGFIPEMGLSHELASIVDVERKHIVIQFMDIPRTDDIETLRTHGVELLDYLPNYAYFASAPVEEFNYLAMNPNVRSVIPIQLEDKISPYIRYYGVGSWAKNEDGTVRLTVVFFGDVARESAINLVEMYGRVIDAPEKSNIFMISMLESSIYILASEDAVQWIEEAPPEKQTYLDQARGTIGADIVQASPYNLDGTGVTVAMWDSGRVDPDHDDFAGRLVIGDGYATTSSHSTHVGGIMAGDGTLSTGNFRGVAINSNIRSYEWPGTITELDTETTNALTNNAILSQNSWGWTVDPPTYPCSLHGDYDSWSVRYDQIVNGVLGDEIVLVGAAGNEENDGDCPPYPWNQTIGPICTGKNSICVGAIYSDTLDHTCFSSRGPTDDGRLKPDIVAPGDQANDHASACLTNSEIRSTIPGDTYGEMGGTSMSAPMVSGAVALLRQQFNKLGYGEIKPHTYKAILAEAANDLGNLGPDYTFGHGNLDIREAADLIINNYPNNELIRTGTVIDNEIDTYYMSVPLGLSRLRVTLAWDDLPGTAGAAKELVNDLDLYLISPTGANYFAYKLDPKNPGNVAGTGWNALDNLEVVEVDNPTHGKWSVKVWGWIVTGTEEYTVVAPFEDINCGDSVYHDTALGHDLTCAGDGLEIRSNSVTLDCQGHTLQGTDTGSGIENTYNYVTIKWCVVRDFDFGIYMHSIADNNDLLNNVALSNDYYGIYLDDAWSNEINANNADYNGVSIGGSGIGLYNSRYNQIKSSNFRENIGHGIYLVGTSYYNTIEGNLLSGNDRSGMGIHSNSNTIRSNTATSNSNYGCLLSSTSGNTLESNIFETNGITGIYIYNSTNTQLIDNYIYKNVQGVSLDQSNNNILRDSQLLENSGKAIYLYQSHNNDILNNFVNLTGSYSTYLLQSNDTEIRNNIVGHPITAGIFSSTSYNTVFNNNTVCGVSWDFYLAGSTYTADLDKCDLAYQFVDSGQPSGCDFECSGCRKAEDDLYMSEDTVLCPYTYNIQDNYPSGPLGVIIINKENVQLDCQGAEIIGVSTGSGWGIKNLGYDYVRVRNCKIHNYFIGIAFESGSNFATITNNNVSSNSGGIRLLGSNYGTVTNNIANSNTQIGLIVTLNSFYNVLRNNIAKANNMQGIAVYQSNNNIVEFNQAIGNTGNGIYIDNADGNTIRNNIVEGNTGKGVFFSTSTANNNILNHNRVCDNFLDISDADTNSGDDNFCDTTSNWNDIGTTGCSFTCLLGDTDVDGDVDDLDLYHLGRAYGASMGLPAYNPATDLDVDNDVDKADLDIFAANYGKTD